MEDYVKPLVELHHIANVMFDNIKKLETQIEKMKCCENCKHTGAVCEDVDLESFTGKLCNKWELAE